MDFADEIEKLERESERLNGYVRDEDIRGIVFDNLEKYGEKDRFEIVGDDIDMHAQLVDGIRTQVRIGNTVTYVCKRGHKCGVFIPKDEYEERFEKKKKEEK